MQILKYYKSETQIISLTYPYEYLLTYVKTTADRKANTSGCLSMNLTNLLKNLHAKVKPGSRSMDITDGFFL